MRVSLGLVFLIFGIGKFKNDIWAETIKTMDFFLRLPWNVNISVLLIGIIEILTGAALIIGLFTRFFAAMAAAQLMWILSLLNFQETRDIGLLGMAIYMTIVDNDAFAIGWLWRKQGKGKMKKHFSFIIGLFLVMFMSLHCFAASQTEEQYAKGRHKTTREISKNPELSGKLENGIRTIEVKASRYKFEPDPIVVRLGERVRLVVTSTDVAHGIAISDFNVKLSVPAGKTEHIEFIADKQGEFHAYCSVYCGSGHGHMHASFIVK